jgi:hypothetical protein
MWKDLSGSRLIQALGLNNDSKIILDIFNLEGVSLAPASISKPSTAVIVQTTSSWEEVFWLFMDKNSPHDLEVAEKLALVSGYTLTVPPYESGFAGYKDWFIQEHGRPGFTVEFGRGANPLSTGLAEKIYGQVEGLLVQAALLS